ncbi:MAG: hypothetical protein ACR2KT_01250 [Methylocella sp.]|nr:MAG: hypothetical protein DLM68_17745 [Hyphomicrobiales bacterium]
MEARFPSGLLPRCYTTTANRLAIAVSSLIYLIIAAILIRGDRTKTSPPASQRRSGGASEICNKQTFKKQDPLSNSERPLFGQEGRHPAPASGY